MSHDLRLVSRSRTTHSAFIIHRSTTAETATTNPPVGMNDPIFALQYSYYEIYLNAAAAAENDATEALPTVTPRRSVDKEQVHSQDQDNDNDDKEDSDLQDALWIQDTWTTVDEEAAQATIQQHAAKCAVSPALQRRLPTDAQAWDRFYQQHQTKFFKDRHYLKAAFPHEFTTSFDKNDKTTVTTTKPRRTLVEIGCGVGNTMLPLLDDDHEHHDMEWTVYGIDLSAVAISLLQQDERYQPPRAWAGVANLVSDEGLPAPCRGVADVATLLFCLSAVAPQHHAMAAANAVQALRTDGGILCIRDYGRYDQAELQLACQRAKRLTDLHDHYYVKHDQTKCYYFTTQDLRTLFVEQLGLEELENGYIQRQYQNRGTKTTRRRVWVQARFRLNKIDPND